MTQSDNFEKFLVLTKRSNISLQRDRKELSGKIEYVLTLTVLVDTSVYQLNFRLKMDALYCMTLYLSSWLKTKKNQRSQTLQSSIHTTWKLSPSKKLYSYCKQNINYDKNIYSYYLKLHPMYIFKYSIIHHATASKGHPPSSQLLQIFYNQPK